MSALTDFFRGRKVLITGNTGFKGSWLTTSLLEAGAEVLGYSLEPPTKPSLYEDLGLDKKIHQTIGDVRDFEKTQAALTEASPEILFHMAAQPLVPHGYTDPLYTFSTNVMGTANVLEAVRNVGSVRAVVVVTSDKVYCNNNWHWAYRETDTLGGRDPYSASKACAELVTKSYTESFFNVSRFGTDHQTLVASARAGNVIGGGDWSADRLVPDIIRAIFEEKRDLVLRNPSAVRPWQHVMEPILGYLVLARELYAGKTEFASPWNLGPPDSSCIPVKDLVQKGLSLVGMETRYKLTPDPLRHEDKLLKLDAAKARAHLAWRPLLNIDEAIHWTFGWYQKYYAGEDALETTRGQVVEFLEKERRVIEGDTDGRQLRESTNGSGGVRTEVQRSSL